MNRLRRLASILLLAGLRGTAQTAVQPAAAPALAAPFPPLPQTVLGFRDFSRQAHWDATFLRIPSASSAREHLRRLTAAPHWASSPEDYATAEYVAARFRAAGLETRIVPYSVLMNRPVSISIDAFGPEGEPILHGPTPERVALPAADMDSAAPAAADRDPRILPGFNSSSPSGDVTGPVLYANYGRLQDFQRLARMGISIEGKIILVRYGGDFRGVKVYLAQHYGAAGVLIYSDPADGGAIHTPAYPAGPGRPGSAVQRGSVQFLPVYPGDPTTPGIGSVPNLPARLRLSGPQLAHDIPLIPVNPISSDDAAPILRALTGPTAPQSWQRGLSLAAQERSSADDATPDGPYHLGGTSSVTVHMHLVQDARLRTIWDVIGRTPGAIAPNELVLAGNHRDAWVYGAADPGSGTAAMLEAVRGIGELLKQGWRPARTIVFASWDAEEEGLVGSTEWAEQYAPELSRSAVAYLNMDVAVSGPNFNAGAVPSLNRFLREIAREVPSPAGGSVYDRWLEASGGRLETAASSPRPTREPTVGDLGSGSDYTPFLQHLGIPSTDLASDGAFGVYHTPYDNFDWFSRFADPGFLYTQQQARFFGLEVLHMASADVLPLDDQTYAQEIQIYLEQAEARATARGMDLDFAPALAAVRRFETAGAGLLARETSSPSVALDRRLAAAERALLLPLGLPRRPWYRHSIYAPGEFTGYSAAVIPGVNEAIDASDPVRAQAQLSLVAEALDRAASVLTSP